MLSEVFNFNKYNRKYLCKVYSMIGGLYLLLNLERSIDIKYLSFKTQVLSVLSQVFQSSMKSNVIFSQLSLHLNWYLVSAWKQCETRIFDSFKKVFYTWVRFERNCSSFIYIQLYINYLINLFLYPKVHNQRCLK